MESMYLFDIFLGPVVKNPSARRATERVAFFNQGPDPQHKRNNPRVVIRKFSGAARDYYITLVVVVDYSIYMR